MTASRPAWLHAVNGATLVAILAVAAVVLHTTPTREMQQSAVRVAGAIGETTSGRNIRATVDSVELAEAVTAGNGWAGTTPGVWVVVELQVEALVDDEGVFLGTALLQIGDVSYAASVRPQTASLANGRLITGIPVTGPLMFELPVDAVSGRDAAAAQLQLAVNDDPRADSLLVMPVDLDALTVQSSLEVDYPEWGQR
ncbi:MAG: hypothetical protein ABWY68_10390 [Cryobacterium sp.]